MVHRDALSAQLVVKGRITAAEVMVSKQMIIWHAKGAILSDMLLLQMVCGGS